jgi:Na+/H+-translocating membrane pyrophosphatase
MKINWRFGVVIFSVIVGVTLLFVVHPYFMEKYMSESPQLPIARTGNIHPYFQHGVTVYLSAKQMLVLNGAVVGGVLAFLVGGVALKSASARRT